MRRFVLPMLAAGCAPDSVGDVRVAPQRPDAVAPTTPDPEPATEPVDPTTAPPTTPPTTDGEPPLGVDVSHWNGEIDWEAVAAGGYGFAYAKATEGTYFVDDSFEDQSGGAFDAGLYRGGYHFGIPDDSSGAEQARFFVDNGGGWTEDGYTLPGVLDIEWNPNSGNDCYDLSEAELEDWVADFTEEYRALTGRDAVIYTSRTWWNLCVDSEAFSANPLWVADWGVSEPEMPTGWSVWTFWQTDAYGTVPGIDGDSDLDVFGGPPSQLAAFAAGT
ncbi:MAG: lysozyme [Deltaproteobacteria bacterium]|nr:lysozyme [Deltaproteobacteria bacterium]